MICDLSLQRLALPARAADDHIARVDDIGAPENIESLQRDRIGFARLERADAQKDRRRARHYVARLGRDARVGLLVEIGAEPPPADAQIGLCPAAFARDIGNEIVGGASRDA